MPTQANQLREKEDYQKLILERLQTDNGFIIRKNTSYNPGLAMDTELLLQFLHSTQEDQLKQIHRFYQDQTDDILIKTINAQINQSSRGLIDVLKHGVDFSNGANIKLMYRKPDSTINTDAVALYNKNIFSVMEEVYHKSDERIDLVLFLNGLAIFTVELKCNTSGQNFSNAIRQYKEERDASTRLFKDKIGVLAAFAMDLNEVYFTTKLAGKNTHFHPFNLGDGKGKGNPVNPHGLRVSYMWENIWKKDQLLTLIERFIFIKKFNKVNKDTGKSKEDRILIFPRFHQLRAVEKVALDIRNNYTSRNYLIEHSAGSGKTETISWLAHTLATLHDEKNKTVIDTVLVITDRIVVDRQLQDAILSMAPKSGQVKVMNEACNSDDLAKALAGHTKIIVTTIHKFSYILENNLLSELKKRHFAVLIDEAHSSTDGALMENVTYVLSDKDNEDENQTENDKILKEIKKAGKQANVTMVAFTATPKPETIDLFGTPNKEGKKEAYDLYSMKQAIEEGYILNVLDNYVTWKTYCQINKAIDADPELKSIAAKRQMARYIDLHDTNITQKIEIIIEHFKNNVAGMLGGQAKAMIVTSSRGAAVKYKHAFIKYIQEHGYQNMNALVAFTGVISLGGNEYTEVGMNNGVKEEKLRYEFDRNCYQVLIVANKYQTGFDQKKLVAMYVDKTLKGINAVQTLSRLNRICPPYDKSTFVLDFKNTYEDITKAFSPFYKETILGESITPADIREMDNKIDAYGFLDTDDIEEFNQLLYKAKQKRTSKDEERMWCLLDQAIQTIRAFEKTTQEEIRISITRFLKAYRFLIQATAYENINLHKRFNFLKYLIKEINPGIDGNNFDITNAITVSDFRQKLIAKHMGTPIKPNPVVNVKKTISPTVEEDQKRKLSELIEEINARYNKNFEVVSATNTVMQIRNLMMNTPEIKSRLAKSARTNSLPEFSFTFSDCVDNAIVRAFDQNTDFFTVILNNDELRTKIKNIFMGDIYNTLHNNKSEIE